jgi:hypothetical protein
MKDDKKILSKDELKVKLDTLGEEIKYRVAEAKKDGVTEGAHKTDEGVPCIPVDEGGSSNQGPAIPPMNPQDFGR